jgi:hypothetical protein
MNVSCRDRFEGQRNHLAGADTSSPHPETTDDQAPALPVSKPSLKISPILAMGP